MRKSCAYVFCLLILFVPSFAQVGPSTTTSDRQRDRAEADLQRRMLEMHTLEQRLALATRKPRRMPAEPKLSEEDRDRVLKLRRVSTADIAKYSGLLATERTGIFKLFPDLGCISKNVVRLTRQCERFVPLSSSFTFRTNGYSDEVYHDIYFRDEGIRSDSFFSQGIIAALGDEPLEAVSLSHPACGFLTSFTPAEDPKAAAEDAKKFKTGVESEKFRYSDRVEPQNNVTYLMRMIAYRLENSIKPLSDETTMDEMMLLSLPFDKRIDIVVAFRILGRDEYDGLTIVWKELSRNDAPKIKFTKNQALRDFRPYSK